MYKTLDQWFGSSEKSQKTFFYFDSNTMESTWLHEKPKEATFSTIIKWNKVPIMLCTNLEQKHTYEIPKERNYNIKQLTYFKSNLQKCVRRQLNEKAVKTAYHFLKLSLSEFLRRLTIIILEDVQLHESYSTLVWLMGATSTQTGFKVTKYIIDWLLGLVNILCNINEYDEVGYMNKNTFKITDFNDYDLLYSLQLRESYKGMYYDVNMVNYFTGLWYERFKNKEKCNETPIKLIDSSKVKGLSAEDWKLEGDNITGVDFHCAPQILEDIATKFEFSEKEVKSAIWHCSSGINKRKKNEKSEKDMEIWSKIEKYYYGLQAEILNTRFSL